MRAFRRVMQWGLMGLVVGIAVPSSAYWASNHVDLNRQVFTEGKPWDQQGYRRGSRTVKTGPDYLAHQLYVSKHGVRGVGFKPDGPGATIGSDTPDDAPSDFHTIPEWLAKGGLWEDGFLTMSEATQWGGRRAVNHFHDPLSVNGGGYTGITDADVATALPYLDLLRRGISSSAWVMNGTSGGDGNGKNHWGYPTIGKSFHKAFTEHDIEKRRSALAAAFRSMGQVMHLVEDNTVPDHARDLPHPGDGWEEYLARSRPDVFGAFKQGWVVFPARLVEQGGLRALWDRDVYHADHSVDVTGSDPPGLDEYVNSNFLAWNRTTQVAGVTLPGSVDFSTIPEDDNVGYVRIFGLSTNPLPVRLNVASYPFPRIQPSSSASGYFDTAPGSLPFSPAAAFDNAKNARVLTNTVWSNYVTPLMSAAHGYAQTVLSLALQPARAELVTAGNGEFLKVGVRLWNLWPAGGPHSVTWHVDDISVVGIRPAQTGADAFLPNDPINIPTLFDVAPGAKFESPTIPITWKQRAALAADSHTVVLVTAHIGDTNRTPLLFSVPIPNAYPLVKQTSGQDTTAPYVNSTPNCHSMPMGCEFEGENATYRNPLQQHVKGEIQLLPTEADILGRPADPAIKIAQREDARIAEVFLYGWPRSTTHQTYEPVHAVHSNLTLTNSNLTRATPGRWVRKEDAPDEPDIGITFDATIDVKDFIVPDLGDDLEDAARAGGSIYVGVMTTAGAFYATRLILWPVRSAQTVAQLVAPHACDIYAFPRPGLLPENRGVCHVTKDSNNMCFYEQYRTQLVFADAGFSLLQIPMGDPLESTWPLANSDSVRPATFMGRTINLYTDAQLPQECATVNPSTVYPSGSGIASCDVFAPNGLSYFASDYTPRSGGGACPNFTGLGATPRVTYKRVFLPQFTSMLKKQFGLKDMPQPWTFDLQ